MRNYALAIIGLWYICGKAKADCVSDLMSGKGRFMQCISALSVGMQTIDESNPYSMCQGSVSEQFTCLNDYVMECPQLVEGESQFASIVSALDHYQTQCSKNKTASPDQSCPQLVTCTEKSAKDMDPSKNEATQQGGESTPFSIILNLVDWLCSLIKGQIACFDASRDACPEEVERAEQIWYSAFDDYITKKFSLDSIKMLTNDLCPGVPSGFTSNMCVREKMESDGFILCIATVKKMSMNASREEQCQFYFDGKACIEDHIGKPCGQENAKVFVDMAPLVIHDLPQNCNMPKKISSDGKNASDRIHSVVATLLLCLMACNLPSL